MSMPGVRWGLGIVGGLLIGLVLQLVKDPVLSLYKVSPEVIENAGHVINVVTFFLWIRVNNMTIVVGILRAGGDTRFSLISGWHHHLARRRADGISRCRSCGICPCIWSICVRCLRKLQSGFWDLARYRSRKVDQ